MSRERQDVYGVQVQGPQVNVIYVVLPFHSSGTADDRYTSRTNTFNTAA